MAGFEVITYGRFWVTAKALGKEKSAGAKALILVAPKRPD
jgi:hypothetical protein